ncbi:MAG: hypothetical protein H6577_13840 [Lewinellaceae bacterium]|nr:hypothetical protein [Saprospiraceae bacterium]MCB9339208.1 hypothetical protein [Lewinellaceae bacterium]
MKNIPAYSFLLFLLLPVGLQAQKKILGKPDIYVAPVDYFDEPSKYQAFLQNTSTKSKDDGWMVVSDRDDNQVFDKPNGTPIGTVGFREYFFVTDEKDDWVEIIDATVDELKVVNLKRKVGWLPKTNLLLWNSGLVGQSTHIHKKVLLLNRADDIQNVIKYPDKNLVKIFRGPNTDKKEPDRRIFDFYFILKKDPDRGMLLLSQEAIISPFTLDKIIGWVSARRCDPWDTRICLEPNFDEAAYNERRENKKVRMRAFKTEAGARQFSEGSGGDNEIFWEDDPVIIRKEKMAQSNPRRFKGSVVRFPMINVSSSGLDNFEYYQSGVIGSIKIKKDGTSTKFESEIAEADYAKFQDYLIDLERKAKKVNVFFVVEGTDSMYAYRQQVVQALKTINTQVVSNVPDVSYGALVYRDLPEESVSVGGQKVNRLTEYVSLTQDFDKVVNFLNKVEYKNIADRDPYTALFYGLSQALTVGGFRPDELNVIILVGCYGDFRIDSDRKTAAVGHPALMENIDPIVESLSKINAHFYSVQVRNDGTTAARSFANVSRHFMLESAKFAYNRQYGNRRNPETQELLSKLQKDYNINVQEPTMAEINEMDNISLIGGRIPGRLIKAPFGKNMEISQLATIMTSDVDESLEFVRTLKSVVSKIYVEGAAASDVNNVESELKVDAGRFAPALAEFLNQMLKDDEIAKNDLYNSFDEKYKLYTEVTIPRFIQGATHPTVSYVLFMPETDLVEYVRTIQRCLIDYIGSYDKKRQSLFEVYRELVNQFTGEGAYLRNKKPEDLTRSDLLRLMQGVYNQGLRIDVEEDIRIGDIRDEKKVSNEEVDNLMQRFKDIESRLNNILRSADTYEFCYTTDENNRYYWIPIGDVF